MKNILIPSLCVTLLLVASFSFSKDKPYELSMGLGQRYAGLGVSGEYFLLNNVGITAGIGASGGRAGIDFYFHKDPADMNYRLSLGYGLVAEVDCVGCAEDEKYYDYSLGFGLKRHNFEYSLFYLDTREFEEDNKKQKSFGFRTETHTKIGFSFGYIF